MSCRKDCEKLLIYESGNICYRDVYYMRSLISKYGQKKVEETCKEITQEESARIRQGERKFFNGN